MGDTTRASRFFWKIRRELKSQMGMSEKARRDRWVEFYEAASPSIRNWLERSREDPRLKGLDIEENVDQLLQATFGVLLVEMTDPKFNTPMQFRGWLPALIKKAIDEWYRADPTRKQVQLAPEFVQFLQAKTAATSPLDSILAAEDEIDEALKKQEEIKLQKLQEARRIVRAEYCGPNAQRSNATTWGAYEYTRKRIKYPNKSEATLKRECGVSKMSDRQIATCASRVKAKIERELQRLYNESRNQ
jgi:hypothetical protein